jgi:hypothetical protein
MESELSLESSWIGQASEWPKENSEKQKEAYKKAQSQLQKTKKDEWKAQGDATVLFHILTRFIQNPYYEEFVPIVTEVLSKDAPARLILWLISLVYPEAALHILTSLGRKQDIEILLSIHKYEKRVDLDESTLHPSIRSWMNTWSYTSRMYLIENEASTVQKQRLIHLLESQDKDIIIRAFAFSLSFFFLSRNIIIDTKKARSYAEFMIAEYKDSLHKNLKTADTDLIFSEKEIESSRFFGL